MDSTPAPAAPAAPAALAPAPTTPPPAAPSPMRLVLFRLPDGASKGQIRPAVVIDADGMIADLAVFVKGTADFGTEIGGSPVKYYAQVNYQDEATEPGHWCWAPYQKGQAQKNDGDIAALRTEVAALRASLNTLLSQGEQPAAAAAPAVQKPA